MFQNEGGRSVLQLTMHVFICSTRKRINTPQRVLKKSMLFYNKYKTQQPAKFGTFTVYERQIHRDIVVPLMFVKGRCAEHFNI